MCLFSGSTEQLAAMGVGAELKADMGASKQRASKSKDQEAKLKALKAFPPQLPGAARARSLEVRRHPNKKPRSPGRRWARSLRPALARHSHGASSAAPPKRQSSQNPQRANATRPDWVTVLVHVDGTMQRCGKLQIYRISCNTGDVLLIAVAGLALLLLASPPEQL